MHVKLRRDVNSMRRPASFAPAHLVNTPAEEQTPEFAASCADQPLPVYLAAGAATVSVHFIDRLIFHHQVVISYYRIGSEEHLILKGEGPARKNLNSIRNLILQYWHFPWMYIFPLSRQAKLMLGSQNYAENEFNKSGKHSRRGQFGFVEAFHSR